MRAFYITAFGGPEVMKYGELPEPTPEKDEVLVKVKAASLNPMDWKMRRGDLKAVAGKKFPMILGTDFSGVVIALGKNVTGFGVGDAVYGALPMMSRKSGALAEFIAVPIQSLRHLPKTISFEQAASLTVAGLTALNGLRLCGDISQKTILINGATGGVGHFATQIAKAKGAAVTAVCSAKNADKAREFGAVEVLDYRKHDFMRSGKTYDVVYDVTGSLRFKAAAPAINSKGCFVTTQPSVENIASATLKGIPHGKRIILGFLRTQPEDFAELEQHIQNECVKVHIEYIMPLSKASEAFNILEKGVTGKIVLDIAL